MMMMMMTMMMMKVMMKILFSSGQLPPSAELNWSQSLAGQHQAWREWAAPQETVTGSKCGNALR